MVDEKRRAFLITQTGRTGQCTTGSFPVLWKLQFFVYVQHRTCVPHDQEPDWEEIRKRLAMCSGHQVPFPTREGEVAYGCPAQPGPVVPRLMVEIMEQGDFHYWQPWRCPVLEDQLMLKTTLFPAVWSWFERPNTVTHGAWPVNATWMPVNFRDIF